MSRVDWERFGRIALVVVFCLVLAWYVRPVANFLDVLRDSRAETAQLRELRAENADLRSREHALSRSGAAERGARRMGMIAPGEAPYVVRGLN